MFSGNADVRIHDTWAGYQPKVAVLPGCFVGGHVKQETEAYPSGSLFPPGLSVIHPDTKPKQCSGAAVSASNLSSTNPGGMVEPIIVSDDSPDAVVTQPYGAKAQQQHDAGADSNDSVYDYKIKSRETLTSKNGQYVVLDFLGRGTFGQVVKCWRKGSNQLVAVKISKSHPCYRKQAEVETLILKELMEEDCEQFNIVWAYDYFLHKGHLCQVFEMLQQNLYDFLRGTKFAPLPLRHVRAIVHQVAETLLKLRSMGIIHSDLKPENIMLVDHDRYPFRVKVVDFGSATHNTRTQTSAYLQSRYYRAPEVIIGAEFNEAIDMWSLGCVAAELFLGWPLYPGPSEYDQIRYITQAQGMLDAGLMNRASTKRDKYFKQVQHSAVGQWEWRLKTPEEYDREFGRSRREEGKRFVLNGLTEIMQVVPMEEGMTRMEERMIAEADRWTFLEMLKSMLCLSPQKRITPKEVLYHPFFTFTHLAPYMTMKCVMSMLKVMKDIGYYKQHASIKSDLRSCRSRRSSALQAVQSGTSAATLFTSTAVTASSVKSVVSSLMSVTEDAVAASCTYPSGSRRKHQSSQRRQAPSLDDIGYISAEPSPQMATPHSLLYPWRTTELGTAIATAAAHPAQYRNRLPDWAPQNPWGVIPEQPSLDSMLDLPVDPSMAHTSNNHMLGNLLQAGVSGLGDSSTHALGYYPRCNRQIPRLSSPYLVCDSPTDETSIISVSSSDDGSEYATKFFPDMATQCGAVPPDRSCACCVSGPGPERNIWMDCQPHVGSCHDRLWMDTKYRNTMPVNDSLDHCFHPDSWFDTRYQSTVAMTSVHGSNRKHHPWTEIKNRSVIPGRIEGMWSYTPRTPPTMYPIGGGNPLNVTDYSNQNTHTLMDATETGLWVPGNPIPWSYGAEGGVSSLTAAMTSSGVTLGLGSGQLFSGSVWKHTRHQGFPH